MKFSSPSGVRPPTTRQSRGVLIIEAVVAAFLMVFAFAASSALFNAALQWESQGANVRRAAMVADKKLEELRSWSADYHRTHSFDDGWSTQTGLRPEYAEAPGFEITVIADDPTYDVNPNTGELPLPGLYSPTSHFFGSPGAPGAFPADFPNQQKNQRYQTFSYVRSFNDSCRRVQVVVRYGVDNAREFRAVTLITDPIADATPVASFNLIQGSPSLSAGSPAADYEIVLTASPGSQQLKDVVCLWNVDPTSTGTIFIKPLDANGRSVRVFRDTWTTPGQARFKVRCRYRGREYPFTSPSFSVS